VKVGYDEWVTTRMAPSRAPPSAKTVTKRRQGIAWADHQAAKGYKFWVPTPLSQRKAIRVGASSRPSI
jgi:hypothetical protein